VKPVISSRCFACGRDNPIGLRLKIEGDKKRVTTKFRPGREHEGWEGVVHGGILATLLDEVVAWICVKNGIDALTGRLEIRFRKPAKVGEELSAHAEITDSKGRAVKAKAQVVSAEKEVVAEAEALLLRGA
jgi:uncharacterized protein (TIGR00369 family)